MPAVKRSCSTSFGTRSTPQQGLWLTQRLYQLYEHAIRHDGEVSIGLGVELYRAVIAKLQGELDGDDSNHRQTMIRRLVSVFRAAHDKKINSATRDFVTFSGERLPGVLRRQINDYQSIVGSVAEAMRYVAGPREALGFLIHSMAHEPRWFEYTRQDGWNQHAWQLSRWRTEVDDLGDLEAPLLAIVTKELRRELETRESHNRYMYWRDYSHFWEAKKDAFLRTAETVYAQRRQSGAAVEYVARYVADGLDNRPRAIEMLMVAWGDGILDESGQSRLVDLLHREERFRESISVLQPMVEKWPENMDHRTRLMHAYFRTRRPDDLLTLLEQTDTYFHADGRWNENAMSQLAHSCLNNELYEQSVKYYTEVIPLHKRTQPGRGIGGGALSYYCVHLARAYAGLGKTAEAVDAASEAVVSWGTRQNERRDALESLVDVLRQAKDLDQYVQALDRETRESGLDKPIVRKAIGQVYLGKMKYAKAITQLKLAAQLQPNDAETHRKLIECLDAQGDGSGAIAQSLASLQLSPRDIGLYKKSWNAVRRSRSNRRGGTGLHFDSGSAAARIRGSRDVGRDSPGAGSLGGRGWRVGASREDPLARTDRSAASGGRSNTSEAMERRPGNRRTAQGTVMATAVRQRIR